MNILLLVGNNKEKLIARFENIKCNIIVCENRISLPYVRKLNPDWCISYNYKYIVDKDVLSFLANKIVNMHISYLPWNRGAHPNLWSFVDNTPKGVSIHIMDDGIDTGPIIARKLVSFNDDTITLRQSYSILQEEIINLFFEIWPQLVSNKLSAVPQDSFGEGSIHYLKDFEAIKHILEPELWDISIRELKRRLKENDGIKGYF